MTQNIVLTAIVPARNGCNLKCAGCIIDQRKEAETHTLRDEDYIRFFEETFSLPEVTAFGIQGHEALLPESFDLSERLLGMSIERGLLSSVITNGVFLKEYAERLMKVTHNIYVSLDSHDEMLHDLSRGKSGAWRSTVSGIQHVQRIFGESEAALREFSASLSVASILYPKGKRRLEGIPKLLNSLGVRTWLISPYISVSKGRYATDYATLCQELVDLDAAAKEYGVELILGDELKTLKNVADLYEALSVNTLEGGELITRLSPDGSYSIGKEILSLVKERMWDRSMSPTEFVRASHTEYKSKG
jgi:MoaA/NifB/PqqE/SkfB family radical SAM enzyme